MEGRFLCFLLATFVASSLGLVFNCVDPNNCHQCPPFPPNCENFTKCGCCNICEDTLKEGESCVLTIFMSTLSQKQCGPGLMCDPEIMKCQLKSNVLAKLFTDNSNKVVYQRSVLQAVSCNDSVCFCVHEGQMIEGYNLLKKEQVTKHSCNCAHKKEQNRKTGLIGKIFLCDEEGSYRKIQCLGSVCHCVDEKGEKLENLESFPISDYASHSC